MTPEQERKREIMLEAGLTQENQPVGLDQVTTATRLLDKNYSPLIVRKYQMYKWP